MSDRALSSLRVRPGRPFDLGSHDTDAKFGWHKEAAVAELQQVTARIDLLQQRLYAEDRRGVLLVMQARDAAGKDGTIRAIFSGVNPAGVEITSFKVPAGREAKQDFLWRVHAACPPHGQLRVFNRSHYEDVLVVRVKELVPKAVWSKRFDHINAFEKLLVDEGTTIVKVFLNVSRDKQRERLQERIDDPEKRWKFRSGDLGDRALWDEFQVAYQEAIARTSTRHAPWYVVPADRNWVRNLAVARILLDAMESLDPQLPPAEPGIEQMVVI